MNVLSQVILFACACGTVLTQSAELRRTFLEYEVVPNVFPVVPPVQLSVRYFTESVDAGEVIPAYNAVLPPYITYDAISTGFYTLAFIEPDVPSRIPSFDGQYLHNLIMNIPGNNITGGDEIVQYISPNPTPGSEYHRFVFAVYRQPRRVDVTTPEITRLQRNLLNFSLYRFTQSQGFGNPIAANFFLSELIICPNVKRITCDV